MTEKLLPDIGYPQTGDTVKAGAYACMECPHIGADDPGIAVLEKDGKLPECPIHGITYWYQFDEVS